MPASTGVITAEALTITAAANTKAYDGTTAAAAVPSITSGSLGAGDTANFTETYKTRNVGTGLTLTPSGTVNDGNGGNNYTYSFVAASQGTITPATLTITATSDTKVYDGTTSSSQIPTYGTLYAGDTVTGLTQAFRSKNVLGVNGSTLIVTGYTVNDGDNGADYTVTTQQTPGTITPAALTITATSDTKVYDGTTTSSKSPTHGSLYAGDTVTGLTQAFASKNALGASGSTLIVTGYTINDGDGGNDYTVTEHDASGTVTPTVLIITATSDTKVYDGTTSSAQIPTHGTLYDGDTVTGLTQAFTSMNVLGVNGSTLTVTGYTINDGDGGRDYTVTIETAKGTITRAALTVRANNESAVYGSSLPALTYTITGLVGADNSSVVSGMPVIATTAAAGDNAGVYPITIAVGTLSAANYSIPAANVIGGALDRDARTSGDHGRLNQHVRRPVGPRAHSDLHRIRQWRHAGQSDDTGGPLHDRDLVEPGRQLPDHRRRRRLTQLHDHLCSRHAQRDPPAAGHHHAGRPDRRQEAQCNRGHNQIQRPVERGASSEHPRLPFGHGRQGRILYRQERGNHQSEECDLQPE